MKCEKDKFKKMIDKLKQLYGLKCTAININGNLSGFINNPSIQMKFCEAVMQSFKVPIKIDATNLSCMGAKHSFGFDNNDEELAKTISVNNQIPLHFVNDGLQKIPVINNISHINLGMTKDMVINIQPDLYIMYVPAYRITELIHNMAKIGIKPLIPPYSLLSVCGNVFVNCVTNQTVSISFGCPESRISGGIGKNEIVLGLPHNIAQQLLSFTS